MRGSTARQLSMLSAVTPDELVPPGHPVRCVRPMVDQARASLTPAFDAMYAADGRPSSPPEHLLEGCLLMALYSIAVSASSASGCSTTCSSSGSSASSRAANLGGQRKPKRGRRRGGPPPAGGGRNPEVDFRGQRRSNETHSSATDPDARLARKGTGREAKLCLAGHVLMENRNGLVVDVEITSPK